MVLIEQERKVSKEATGTQLARSGNLPKHSRDGMGNDVVNLRVAAAATRKNTTASPPTCDIPSTAEKKQWREKLFEGVSGVCDATAEDHRVRGCGNPRQDASGVHLQGCFLYQDYGKCCYCHRIFISCTSSRCFVYKTLLYNL